MVNLSEILKSPREVFIRFVSLARKNGDELPPESDFDTPRTSRDRLLQVTLKDVYRNQKSPFSGASDDTVVVEAARQAGIIE